MAPKTLSKAGANIESVEGRAVIISMFFVASNSESFESSFFLIYSFSNFEDLVLKFLNFMKSIKKI